MRSDEHERRGASASLRSPHPGLTRKDWEWVAVLDAWSSPAVFALLGGILLAVAVADGATGGQFGLSILYLLPVGLAAWRWGTSTGALWALAAAVTWLVVETNTDGIGPGVAAWNSAARFAGFLVLALALGALRRERDTVRTLAGTDHLTGVQNASSFGEVVELERSRSLRYNRPFTLAYLDVDGFKVINEEWGHTAGDQALRLVARTIRDNIRSMDSVSRMGGDEFALLFPETGQGDAEVALHKIQSRLDEAMTERSLPMTFTLGGVICVGAPQSVDDLIGRAESLMYAAKQEGGSGIRTEVLDENFGIQAILQRS